MPNSVTDAHKARRERLSRLAGALVLALGAGLSLARWRAAGDVPLGRGELGLYFFFTVFGAGVAWMGVRAWLAPRKAEYHFEYTMHGRLAGPGRLSDLIDRLAALGRRVEARVLGDDGEPGAAPAPDTALVGTQVELRLAADQGPHRLLLRLRRDPDDQVFGLLEIDDDATMLRRRFAGDVLRELAALIADLGYEALGSTVEARAAASLATGEMP